MLLRFSPAGFAFLLQLVVRAYLLEAQRATAEEFVLAQFGKTTEILTASVKDSFKPINERVSAAVEQFQAAR